MPTLTITYRGKTVEIPITAGWTGTLMPHLHFVAGALSRKLTVDWTEARCAACGDPAELTVTKTTGVEASGG